MYIYESHICECKCIYTSHIYVSVNVYMWVIYMWVSMYIYESHICECKCIYMSHIDICECKCIYMSHIYVSVNVYIWVIYMWLILSMSHIYMTHIFHLFPPLTHLDDCIYTIDFWYLFFFFWIWFRCLFRVSHCTYLDVYAAFPGW